MKERTDIVKYAKYGKFRVDLNDKARVLSGDSMFFEITGYTPAEIESQQITLYDIISDDTVSEIKAKLIPQLIKSGRCFIQGSVKTKYNDGRTVKAYGTVSNILGIVEITIFENLPEYEQEDIHYTSAVLTSTQAGLEVNDILNKHKSESYSFIVMRINNYGALVNEFGMMFTDSSINNFTKSIFKRIKEYYPPAIIGRLNRDALFVFLWDRNYSKAKVCIDISDIVFKKCYMGKKSNSSADFSIGVSRSAAGSDFYSLIAEADKAAFIAAANNERYHIYSSDEIVKGYVPFVPADYLQLNCRNYDFNFMAHAISLLSHSVDLDKSLNLLLETTGLRYNLHAVFVSEFNAADNTMRQTNFWSFNDGVFDYVSRIDDIGRWQKFMSGFDSRGFMLIEDTSSDYFSEKDREFFRKESVYAAINCLLMKDKKIIGYISFCDLKNPRKWSKYEKDTLYELSKLVSLYISVRIDRRDKAEQIYTLSHDNMTGLLNAQTFTDEITGILYENENPDTSFALIYSDIDNFTYINDSFGFQEGNKLICAYADKLKEDFFISCRYYGDKFISLEKFRHKEDLLAKVSVMNAEFSKYMKKNYPLSDLGLSIGIYFFTGSEDYNIPAAIDNANLMRKEAKNKRDVSFSVYSEELKKKRSAELEIIGSVHDAIANGSIEVFLQAKCSLSPRKVIGAEALVRWRNEDGSLKYPDQFIPALEKSGYIVDVDFCIYEQVLSLLAKWKRDGKKLLPISVNFSRMHMKRKDFVDRVCSLASKYGVDRDYIEIEVTESSFSDDKGLMLDCITKIRENGFKIDMDDFGTGYSSLNMLLEAPVDIVKIDKSFIDKSDSPAGQSYIRQIGNIVTASNKDIIFEGVETEEQANFLLDSGYSKIQGYLFDRPIPAKDFEKKYIYV